jgi:hypothetical protein
VRGGFVRDLEEHLSGSDAQLRRALAPMWTVRRGLARVGPDTFRNARSRRRADAV